MTGTYTALATGPEHVCGILEDGRVECSESKEGFFGPGRATPPEGKFVSITAANHYTCGVRDSGEPECWGEDPNLPKIPEFGNFKQIVAHDTTVCALSREGSVECWGVFTQHPAPSSTTFESIDLSRDYACGILIDGRISCWYP